MTCKSNGEVNSSRPWETGFGRMCTELNVYDYYVKRMTTHDAGMMCRHHNNWTGCGPATKSCRAGCPPNPDDETVWRSLRCGCCNGHGWGRPSGDYMGQLPVCVCDDGWFGWRCDKRVAERSGGHVAIVGFDGLGSERGRTRFQIKLVPPPTEASVTVRCETSAPEKFTCGQPTYTFAPGVSVLDAYVEHFASTAETSVFTNWQSQGGGGNKLTWGASVHSQCHVLTVRDARGFLQPGAHRALQPDGWYAAAKRSFFKVEKWPGLVKPQYLRVLAQPARGAATVGWEYHWYRYPAFAISGFKVEVEAAGQPKVMQDSGGGECPVFLFTGGNFIPLFYGAGVGNISEAPENRPSRELRMSSRRQQEMQKRGCKETV